ncbi:DUF2339 domain-containing protein [Saccharopolyspora rosea]|uniref:DUF2339 domain-containing protein n=1 Tax=Saccharopolyspora rosea TaxID=524884 RepID=A0ABW3G080_9PSEU|nr:DUF2339 domain-containing protein [Saccharopolyspora rosea]
MQPQSGEALQAVAGELHAIGQRLTHLAVLLQQETPSPHLAEPGQAPEPPRPVEAEPHPAQPAPQRRKFGARWEPSRVLAWGGAGVTLLGVVFLLVLAAQQGWLGPGLRVGGGAVLGVVLIASGWWLHARTPRSAGFALAATGFAALYLDAVAATSLYGYLPVSGGLGAGLVVAVAGLLLADRWRAQPLAVGVVLGCALCAPLITGAPTSLLVGFLVLLQVAAAPVQLRRGWRVLAVAAAVPTVLAALAADLWAMVLPGTGVVAAVVLASAVGVAIALVTAFLLPERAGTAAGLVVSAPAPALLAAPLLERSAAGALAAGVAVVLAAIWAVGWFVRPVRDLLAKRFTAASGAVAAVAALQATMTAVDASAWAAALLVEALLLTVGAHLLRTPGPLLGAVCYAVLGTSAALRTDTPVSALLTHVSGQRMPGVLVGALIALVAIGIPVTAVRVGKLRELPGSAPLWSLSGLVVLYGTASATMAACLLVRDDRTGFLTGHILITLCWVVAAIVLLLRGVRVAHLRIAGMVLLPVALAKLLLFDLATLDGLARVVAFLCAGLILLAAGARYTRALSRENARS